jgi:hypothetical protein
MTHDVLSSGSAILLRMVVGTFAGREREAPDARKMHVVYRRCKDPG